jgi:hypothetical protein
MSNILFQNTEKIIKSTRNKNNQKLLINVENNLNSNKKNRIESANTNFTSSSHHNIIKTNINYVNKSNLTDNNSGFVNYSIPKQKSKREYKPNWKYSYYLDKNEILSLNKIQNIPELKNTLCDFKDIDRRSKPIVYSWTKPKMVKILEKNANIEEEVKTHYWNYWHIFEKKDERPPGRLLRIIMTQLSHCYGGGYNFLNTNKIYNLEDDKLFKEKSFLNRQWKVPGTYRNNRNNFEPIKLKRPRTAYRY